MKDISKATWFDILLLLIGKRRRVRVQGNSMLPTFADGDEILIKENAEISPDDIVFSKHPKYNERKIIKRISEIDEKGLLFLIGDNLEESTDSRHFGKINSKLLIGKIVKRL